MSGWLAYNRTSPENYEVIRIEKWLIPPGAHLVEAYETADEIIVCGEPPNEYEDPGDTFGHNCDAMGCSSVSHVLYRFQKQSQP